MEPVRKVEITQCATNPTVRIDCTKERIELGPGGLAGSTLYITLQNGREIYVELFEREPGAITIRTGGLGRRIMILPVAANTIEISHGN